MGAIQQELKAQVQLNNAKVDQCAKDQQLIAQQVKANGQALAQLTLRHMAVEDNSFSSSSESLLFEEEETNF